MADSQWNQYPQRAARVGPPLRPHPDSVAVLRRLLEGRNARVLLLGVTEELADLGVMTTAVDRNPAMIAKVWPGDTPNRRAQQADWLSLPFPDGSFTAVIGDGALNNLPYPVEQRAVLHHLVDVLEPGGLAAFRLYVTPDDQESLGALKTFVLSGSVKSFHAFKWHLAMAIAKETQNANVPVRAILGAFNEYFPDRKALSVATGWAPVDIDTLDVYGNSPDVYCFPTLSQFRDSIPDGFGNVRFVPAGTYELSERCPILVMDRKP